MKYLVTGRAGSGKSAVHKRLQELGYNSIDTDRFPGLARWEDTKTRKPVKVDSSKYVDYAKVDWNWQPNILKGILAARKTLYLCGSASNQLEFHPLFDKVFVLTLDPETQLQRLKSRQDDYAKDPRQQEETIRDQTEFVKRAVELGATAIDSTRPLNTVVDDILNQTHEVG